METNYKHDARSQQLSAVAVLLLVTINVRPRWAQSHSSAAPVEVAVEPGEWWIGTGRWRADHLVGSVRCNIAARVPGNEPPESQHLWPYTHCEGSGGQSNVWMVAAQRHTCIPLSPSALTVQGDSVHLVYSYVVWQTHRENKTTCWCGILCNTMHSLSSTNNCSECTCQLSRFFSLPSVSFHPWVTTLLPFPWCFYL